MELKSRRVTALHCQWWLGVVHHFLWPLAFIMPRHERFPIRARVTLGTPKWTAATSEGYCTVVDRYMYWCRIWSNVADQMTLDHRWLWWWCVVMMHASVKALVWTGVCRSTCPRNCYLEFSSMPPVAGCHCCCWCWSWWCWWLVLLQLFPLQRTPTPPRETHNIIHTCRVPSLYSFTASSSKTN